MATVNEIERKTKLLLFFSFEACSRTFKLTLYICLYVYMFYIITHDMLRGMLLKPDSIQQTYQCAHIYFFIYIKHFFSLLVCFSTIFTFI